MYCKVTHDVVVFVGGTKNYFCKVCCN